MMLQLKYSQNNGIQGGSPTNLPESGIKKLELLIKPEKAFEVPIFMGLYLYNPDENVSYRNITMKLSGSRVDPYYINHVNQIIDNTFDYSIRPDDDFLKILNALEPNYLDHCWDHFDDGDFYISRKDVPHYVFRSGDDEFDFKYWFFMDRIFSSSHRFSSFDNVTTLFYKPNDANLFEFDTDGFSPSENLNDSPFESGYYHFLTNRLNQGESCGFYIKLNPNFNLSNHTDFDFISISVEAERVDLLNNESTFINQELSKFIIRVNLDGFRNESGSMIEELYQNYPPFFKYFGDLE